MNVTIQCVVCACKFMSKYSKTEQELAQKFGWKHWNIGWICPECWKKVATSKIRAGAIVDISLTWEQVQQICDILDVAGHAELIKPFEVCCAEEERRLRSEAEFGLNQWGP